MTDKPYVPNDATIRFAATFPNVDLDIKGIDFDRWLAERDATIEAAAEQRGAERAFNESANEVRREMRWQYEQNINRNGDTGDSIDRLLELEKVLKYRADEMEGDDANQGDWCYAEHCPYRGAGKTPTHRRHEHCPVWRTHA